ncbi:MAG: hypothetical protein NVS1B11_36330 [Terriglobales bacterium]
MNLYFQALAANPEDATVTVQVLTGAQGDDEEIIRKVGLLKFAQEEWESLKLRELQLSKTQ